MTELRTQSRITHHVSRFTFSPRLALLAILLLALALRAAPLTDHRFHEDEALYASWALLTTEDPALISVPVDKPPLHIYLLAGLFRLLGPTEAVARLPNLWASVLSVAMVYAIGGRAYDRPTALMAALLYAASPFAILFASTAFTDPLLVLWMLLGLWAALARKPLLAGLALGLAYATKQQAVLLVPLVVAMSICEVRELRGLREGKETTERREMRRPPSKLQPPTSNIQYSIPNLLLRLLAGFLPLFALVTWWDSLRWHVQPSFWDRSLTTYGGLELLPPSAWPERLADWAKLLSYVFASPSLNAIMLIGLPILLWLAIRPHAPRFTFHVSRFTFHASRITHYDLLLVIYVIAYLFLHLAISFQVWDRYLLPLAPLLCLLLARLIRQAMAFAQSVTHHASRFTFYVSRLLIGSLLILLIRPAYLGTTSQLPIGGDHGAYEGIDQLAAYVQAHLPPEARLYYHWLGWHYGYYLRDASPERTWYPDPESLAEQAAAAPAAVRAIAFPAWKDDQPVRQALAARGLTLVPQYATYRHDGGPSFALYLIETTDHAETVSVKSVVENRSTGGER